MLTLKELKKIVKVADTEKRIPTAKSLMEKDIVVKEVINAETDITVYENGYVLYREYGKTTIFPLHACGQYEYQGVAGASNVLEEDFFDNENWYIRLIMEAEDRMEFNQSKIRSNHGIFSYSDLPADVKIMEDHNTDLLNVALDRELIRELMTDLTNRQRTVIELFFFQEMRQQDIADQLGIKQQSVYDSLSLGLKKMRKKAKFDEK